jgi:hypothetical protein
MRVPMAFPVIQIYLIKIAEPIKPVLKWVVAT